MTKIASRVLPKPFQAQPVRNESTDSRWWLQKGAMEAFQGGFFFNPFTAMGHFHKQPPRWPTFLAMKLFQILKEGMGLSLLDELEVQYHVIKK